MEHQINPERLQTDEITQADIEITSAIYKQKWDTLQNDTEQTQTRTMDTTKGSEQDSRENQEEREKDTEEQ